MKVDLKNELRYGRSLKLIPENDLERQELANFMGDLRDHLYLEITCQTLSDYPMRFSAGDIARVMRVAKEQQ